MEATTEQPLRGRVFIVTGATHGIGAHLTQRLAALGATLGLVARDKARGEAQAQALRTNAACVGDVHVFLADLAVNADVHRCAKEVSERYKDGIHVLVREAETQRLLAPFRLVGVANCSLGTHTR